MGKILDFITNNGGLLGNALGFVSSLITNKKNVESQEKINQENLDYAAATTQQQWERDDTSYKRSVEDAVAAGLSPLAVLDGGLVGNSSALGYQGQAPQLDSNSLATPFYNIAKAEYEVSKQDKQLQAQKDIQDAQFEHDFAITEEKFINEITKLENEQKHDEAMQLQKTLDSIRIINEQFEIDKQLEKINHDYYKENQQQNFLNDKKLEELKTQDQNWLNNMQETRQRLQELGVVETREYTSYSEYLSAFKKWKEDYHNFVNNLPATSSSLARSGSKTVFQSSNQQSINESDSVYQQNEQKINEFFVSHPYPLYVGDSTGFSYQQNTY